MFPSNGHESPFPFFNRFLLLEVFLDESLASHKLSAEGLSEVPIFPFCQSRQWPVTVYDSVVITRLLMVQ